MSTEHIRVTSSRVFNNNSRKIKIALNCVQHNCVFRVELDESQCKCVCVSVSFLFFLTSPCTTVFPFFLLPDPVEGVYLYSRDCLASRDMTVSFCVWRSGRRCDFRRNESFL